jgi:hypothetical protein
MTHDTLVYTISAALIVGYAAMLYAFLRFVRKL